MGKRGIFNGQDQQPRDALRRRSLLMLGALALAACDGGARRPEYRPTLVTASDDGIVPEVRFGVVPMENFRHIYEVYSPIVAYLNRHLKQARLTLEVARSLPAHEARLSQRALGFALSNPYQTYMATQRHGYHVFAKMGNDDAFRGIWLVRRDSALGDIGALKGQKICFPPRTALAATMMTRAQLKAAGIDPQRDVQASYVASQENSIMQVARGEVVAGATWPLAWTGFQRQFPEQAALLEVRWPTAPLINQGLIARDDLAPALVDDVGRLLAELHSADQGRAMLAQLPLERFERARDTDYLVVRDFLDRYARDFPAEARP